MMSGRSRFPFTSTQWQELEHQALIYKYMVSGMPIPPDLLFSIKRSLDSSLSSKLFSPQQPHHMGWNCFQMGLGRKVDPEPGRCRRTDGKKWRCSKEAFPDSKYCERHMHRGKNRSRKPVEVSATAAPTNPSTLTISSITKSPSSLLSPTSLSETHNHQLNQPWYTPHFHHPSLYLNTSSSRPPPLDFSPQDNNVNTHLLFDSDYRYAYGLKEEVDEHAFFSEPSGTMRSFSTSSMEDSWNLSPLTMSSSSSKQRSDYSYLQLQSLADTPKHHSQDQHCYVLGSNAKCEMPTKLEREEPQKIHHFFDEWPPKSRDSSYGTSVSTTQLSISIPSSSNDFPIYSTRNHNDH